ncbi:hAT family dimerization protein [Rhizoctonia solani 123E]|uniref:HAT family dimerization protein n=1 Tax=Rhizoctonia solani 123E TaxID=1423351 RepID=A0A074REZ8_9AGAM|nr:hAT family dimerization protein [Rhizoctonia solani 123E]
MDSQRQVMVASTPHENQKRPATSAPAPPASKRMRSSALARSQGPSSIHQIEMAQRAAASVPIPYRIDEQAESTKHVQAARAIDCWALTAEEEHKTEPSNEKKVTLQARDKAHLGSTSIDLRKPRTPWIRCIECLASGSWKVWKNNLSGGSAKHIRAHLVKEHRSAYLAACERINYVPTDELMLTASDDDVNEPLTSEGILRYLTEWFAEDDISFNMVSHRGFRRFVNYLGQGKVTTKDLPDRHSIAAKAATLSVEAKERIKDEIKHARGKVSCTTDLWTDDSQRAFMCITAHFHNAQKRQVNRLIAFRVIEGSHTGGCLAENFFEVMEEFGIIRKLGWITMDNASNNDSMMTQLEEYMVTRGMDFDRHGNRLRCFPHVVNLAVQDILGALSLSAKDYEGNLAQRGFKLDGQPELQAYLSALSRELLERIRRTITALRRTQRRQGLRKTILVGNSDGSWTLRALELKLDCPTRWSSTRDMIERLLYLYPAVSRYIASDPTLAEHVITHADYEALHDILTVLNFAHRAQELLSSDRVPTLSFAIPLYHALVDQWTRLQATLPALSYAIFAGIKKLNAYLDKTRSSPVHIVAMALNPSIRYEWFDRISPSEGEKARATVKQYMLRCLEEQQKERHNSSVVLPNQSCGSSEAAAKRLNIGYSNLLASGVDTRPASRAFPSFVESGSTPSGSARTASEVLQTLISRPSSAVSTHTPTTQTGQPNTALNIATVELEHQKLEQEPVIAPEDMNGLSTINYWQSRSDELPIVYRVALDVLPAQASSVSSERIFSSSKLTCTQHRNHISASNVEALQILNTLSDLRVLPRSLTRLLHLISCHSTEMT